MPDGSTGDLSAALRLARKGRGATHDPANRYEAASRHAFDDGWGTLAEALADLPPLATTLARDHARSAIAWNDSPDLGFDRAVNPYRGCEHGCVYCYARPSHAQLGLSPGLDFESRIVYKPDVADLLARELRRPGYAARGVRPLTLGSNTDPYQPVERTLRLTRAVLEVLDAHDHPVTVVTKSAGVLRDLDILASMARRNLAQVCVSVTTLDDRLARIMEPRAATPARRLSALRALSEAGVPTAILAAPMIPAVNDAELERLLAAGRAAGAARAGYVLLRLPLEVADLFEAWLRAHLPDRAARVLALVRETRRGTLYDARFGARMVGTGPFAEALAARFRLALRRLGFESETNTGRAPLDCAAFRAPADPRQPALL